MYAFFQKYLDLPGNPHDEEMEYLSFEDLKVTESGQVQTSWGGETVFSLNKKYAEVLSQRLANLRADSVKYVAKVKEAAASLAGYCRPKGNSEAVFAGRFQREGYILEKFFIQGEGDYVIPFLLFVPMKELRVPSFIFILKEKLLRLVRSRK